MIDFIINILENVKDAQDYPFKSALSDGWSFHKYYHTYKTQLIKRMPELAKVNPLGAEILADLLNREEQDFV